MTAAAIGKTFRVLGAAGKRAVTRPHEVTLIARMAIWVVLVSWVARLTSFHRVQQIASPRFRSASLQDPSETLARLGRAIDRLLSIDLFVFRPSCWKRAIVLHRFLALNGIDSRINFGVRKNAMGTLEGHAWLEADGQPLLEHDAGAYVVTFSIPRP